MSLRERYRTYLATIWEGTPVGSYVVGRDPVPARPFVIVTAAFPRRRARAAARGIAIEKQDAAAEDESLNAMLVARIAAAGLEALPGTGLDPAGSHHEPSFWVWDATAARAIAWGREFDQFAVLAGDGRSVRILPCYPEHEPPIAPDVVRIFSGDPTIAALLERELRSRGWDRATRFLSATDRETPILVIGIGEAGIDAASADSPWRFGIATPWRSVPEADRDRLFAPGLAALHGGKDDLLEVAALPHETPRLVDPDAGRELEPWIGRVSDGVMRLWSSGASPSAAAAAGWKTPGYVAPGNVTPLRVFAPGGLEAGIGTLLAIVWAAFSLVVVFLWIGRIASDPIDFEFFDFALLGIGLGVLAVATISALAFWRAEPAKPARWRRDAVIAAASGLPIALVGEIAIIGRDAPPWAHAACFGLASLVAAGGLVVLLLSPLFTRPGSSP